MNEKTPTSPVLRVKFMHAPCPTCSGEVVGRTYRFTFDNAVINYALTKATTALYPAI